MGAWGHQNFENDEAMDFVGDFKEAPGVKIIQEAFQLVIEAGAEEEFIETDAASAALAAAEVVAAALGRPSQDVPEELGAIISNAALTIDEKLVKQARKAVKQVLKESELQELWAEDGETNAWTLVQASLLKRLS